MFHTAKLFFVALVLLSPSLSACAQVLDQPAPPDTESFTGMSSPMIPDPDNYPVPPPSAPPQPWRFITDIKLDVTALPGVTEQDIDMNDLEFASTLNFDFGSETLKLTPYVAVHLWSIGNENPFLTLYDLNAEFSWRPRLAEWLFADLALTPGLYTDFKTVNGDSFQMRGRALAIVAFSEKLQIAAGALYINRIPTKMLPAGGVIWTPNADTRCFLVFPQPKVSRRLGTFDGTSLWGYVAGEFGGGRWQVEDGPNTTDSLSYTDLRLLVGLETQKAERVSWHLEFGYVFMRQVNFASDPRDFDLPGTALVRAGFRY